MRQMGHMNETSFYCLSLLTKMTGTTVGDITASELGQFSPIFVWLLRDITINLAGTSPSEYMESALKPVDCTEDPEAVIGRNKVRKSIQAVFGNRHCFTLVRPANQEKELRVFDRISMDRLRPKFKDGMDELRSFVFEKTKPKKIGATVMTGPIFVQITRYILEAFNNGTLPLMACIWENVEKTKRPKALKAATTATVVGSSPAANTRQRKRSIAQRMSSHI